jgi:hypothetical protein
MRKKEMKISYTQTLWRKPVNKHFKIKYFIARYKGNMKNGREIFTNVYQPVVITEKQEKKDKNRLLEKAKIEQAKIWFRNIIIKNLSGKKRIGLPSYKGYFYFLNAEEITNERKTL